MAMYTEAPFGEVLKELRNRKKLSRPRLAQQIHVHPSSIEKWERGDVLPDRARVEELIRALNLSEAERLLLLESHAGYRILPSLHNLPFAQNPYFTGREDIVAQLHAQLAPGAQVALTQAISGLGGIGKTQVALHYAYRFKDAYSHVLWVTADSSETLSAEFVKLVRDLDLPEKDEQDQNKIVEAMKRWLREYLDWLLILDNVEDLELLNVFIPAGHLGSVLLTTRRHVTEPLAQSIVLDVLSESEGILFLLKRTKRLALNEPIEKTSAEEVAVAQAITQQLGGLPLALDQAGAYIAETRCSLSDYIDLLRREQTVLLQRRGTVPRDHPASVTTTFSLAFQRVQQEDAPAIEALKLCAYLAPDAIPLEVMTRGAVHLGTVLEAVAADTLRLNQALETLQAYSLVQRDPEEKTLSMHRLVQAVLQDELEAVEKDIWARRATLAVNAAFPHVEQNTEHDMWPQCERLLPHALQVAHHIETSQIANEEAGQLLHEMGTYLQGRARYPEAERFYRQAQSIWEEVGGVEHPQVASLLNGLADLYSLQGKYEQAEPLFQQAIRILEQALGSEHLEIASPLDGLGCLYSDQGKYKQAESLYQRAVHIREQALGSEHPLVAQPLNNLALLDCKQGKYEQAELRYQQAIRILEQALGSEHPLVAYPLDGLASLYSEWGRYEQAEPLFRRSVHLREQALGPDHPQVAYPLSGLAELYREQRKYKEAESLFQRALHIWEQALGEAHREVAFPLNGLANIYREQSKYEQAEALYLRTLHIRTQWLGSEHPETAEVYYDLAQLREAQGNMLEATSLYQRVLAIRERSLGGQHPKTIKTRHRYTRVMQAIYRQTGEEQEA